MTPDDLTKGTSVHGPNDGEDEIGLSSDTHVKFALDTIVVEHVDTERGVRGETATKAVSFGDAEVFFARLPEGTSLQIALTKWVNGDRDIRVTSMLDSPEPYAGLVERLRLGVYPFPGDPGWDRIDARPLRLRPNRPSRENASLAGWSRQVGFDVEDALRQNGVTQLDTRANLIHDASPRKNALLAVMPANADRAAIATFVCTTVSPLRATIVQAIGGGR